MVKYQYNVIIWISGHTKERRLVARIRWPQDTKQISLMRSYAHKLSIENRPEGWWSYCPSWSSVSDGRDLWSKTARESARRQGIELDDSFSTWTDEMIESVTSELPKRSQACLAEYDKHDLDYANRVQWIQSMEPRR